MPKITGGGINSTVTRTVGVHAGKPSTNVVSPRGTSQLGASQSGRIKDGAHTSINTALNVFERKAAEQPLGNAVALNVGKGGAGTGRTIYRAGTQGVQGSVDPGQSPGRRDILSEFGPEVTDGSAMRRQR
jgi:hypothetical protein